VKADGGLDVREPVVALERRVRAMWPWPRAFVSFAGVPVQVHRAAVRAVDVPVGMLAVAESELLIGTDSGALALQVVQLPGGRPIAGIEAVRSGRLVTGAVADPYVPPETPLVRAVVES
jgi:methionyl-tRNA formyltransferase